MCVCVCVCVCVGVQVIQYGCFIQFFPQKMCYFLLLGSDDFPVLCSQNS